VRLVVVVVGVVVEQAGAKDGAFGFDVRRIRLMEVSTVATMFK
jgi:hypothetical protein